MKIICFVKTECISLITFRSIHDVKSSVLIKSPKMEDVLLAKIIQHYFMG